MQVLVINTIAGRLDRLQVALERGRVAHVDAIFVLGNLPSIEDRPRELLQSDEAEVNAYQTILSLLGSPGLPVYIILGEHDLPLAAFNRALRAYNGPAAIQLVHRAAAYLGDGDVVVGFGGHLTDHSSSINSWHIPSWEARAAFEHMAAHNPLFQLARRRLMLFATPPSGEVIDRDGDQHVGAKVLNNLIRTYQPHIVCCGGPEDGRGVEVVHGTQVVNPGMLAKGAYAIIDLDNLHIRLEWIQEPLPGDVGVAQSIIVALDDSPESWRALETGAGIARRCSAKLTLVHAFEHMNSVLGRPYDSLVGQRVLRGEHLLEKAAAFVADLEPQLELLEGPAADAIIRAANTYHADLIVMGARGRGALQSLLGSVSRRVMRHAPCSVLITRQQPTSAALAERRVGH